MLSLSLFEITLLLATTTLLVKACPLNLTDDCQHECNAYKNSKYNTMVSEFNITATLKSLTNDMNDFQSLNGDLRLENDRVNYNNKACYEDNPTTGCVHESYVDDGIIKEECT